jgi:hypothetical protein
MNGRLAGLKDAIKAERQPPREVVEAPKASTIAAGTRAKARVGKRALGGYFSNELVKTLNMIAVEEETTVQALLGEAVDLLLREKGKHPFGER